MAISEDLRSVRTALDEISGVSLDNALLMRLICNNLLSIAEQVESLENLPLATTELAGDHRKRDFCLYTNAALPALMRPL